MTIPSCFEPTQPAAARVLVRLADPRRDPRGARPGDIRSPRGDDDPGDADGDRSVDVVAGGTRLSALNPSLLQDLQRFGGSAGSTEGIDLLEVMAASLRHARPLLLQVQSGARVLSMTVWPARWRLQCPFSPSDLLALPLHELQLLSVEPARSAEPSTAQELAPLRPLLWELALRGSRRTLLPEISGIATYRIAPGAEIRDLDIRGTLQVAVRQLQRETTPLHHIAQFDGFDEDRAARLLNALYLQAALMISRSHPAGIR